MSSPVPERFRSTSGPAYSPVEAMAALTYSAEGSQQCGLGHHAYTPWTPADEQGVSFCWCARGCGYWLRSDELR